MNLLRELKIVSLDLLQIRYLEVVCVIKMACLYVLVRYFICFISFRSPSLFYLLTVGVEVVYFHSITLRYTPQSVGLLWTRDRPVAETST
jgi:hypothetical protein